VQFLDLATQNIGFNVEIQQLMVGETGEFCPRSIKDMQIRRDLGVIVLAIRKHDGRMLFNPPSDTVIVSGDCLIVMGEPDHLRRLNEILLVRGE
jgi:voltage-gated potassium channel